MKPNLFIVGAPKCGTTSLWYYLNQHPEVFMVPGKEPQYFNDDMEFKNSYTEKEYLNLYKEANEKHKYLGDASPLYLMSKTAAGNIKKFNPDSKIIIMLRNPAEIIFSAYLQNCVNLVESASSFESALLLEEHRRTILSQTVNGQPIQRLFYTQFVQFEEQISRFIDAFGLSAIHFILLDDFNSDTKLETVKVFDFLGLNFPINIDLQIKNRAKQNRSIVLQNLVDNPPQLISRLFRFLFSAKLRSKIYWFIWWSNKRKSKSKLGADLKSKLNKQCISDVDFVAKVLDVNLDAWKS